MKTILFYLTLLITTVVVSADTAEQRVENYNLKNGLAIKGYDPVAYFSGKAEKGEKQYELNHKGVSYRFTTTENLEKFRANPAAYEPQYGGWCAYAFAKGQDKVKVNPKSFKIIDEKLYLFYDTFAVDTLKRWNKAADEEQVKIANENWKAVLGEKKK